ncbi:MAG: alpha/beta hydrolase [Halobaculum sp.]
MTDGETVLVPGGRDVRGTLDHSGAESEQTDAWEQTDTCVVACPPHPQHRGNRGDERLRAVSDALTEQGIDCLRFDYGDWDDGYGERADVRNAVDWAADRYETVGLFGFSFGGTLSLLVASENDGGAGGGASEIDAVAALAPTAKIDDELDATAAIPEIDCPTLVVYGTRDDVADWGPVVEAVEAAGGETIELAADHFFVGQSAKVAEAVGSWLGPTLLADDG